MTDDEPKPEGEQPEFEPRFVLGAGVVVYGAMGTAALLWLWLRDRMHVLPERAVGEHGALAASGLGLAIGVGASFVVAGIARHSRGLQELEGHTRRLFGGAGEGAGLAFVLVAALAEELMFRLAVQDQFGLVGSVAAYTLMHSSAGGLRLLGFTAVHALVLGGVVELGFGLLGSTTAHAVLNYLSLRRIQDR